MLPAGSEASSLEKENVRASWLLPKQVEVPGSDFSFMWRSGREGTRTRAEERTMGDPAMAEGNLAALFSVWAELRTTTMVGPLTKRKVRGVP